MVHTNKYAIKYAVSAWDLKGPGGKLFKGPLKNTKSQNNNLKTYYRYIVI